MEPSPCLSRQFAIHAVALALLLALSPWLSSAQAAPPLAAKVQALALRPRSDAPMMVDVQLTWDGAGTLEGQIELTLRGGADAGYVYRTGDVVLTPGKQTLRFMLPPVTSAYQNPTVRMRFIPRGGQGGRNDAVDLGRDSFMMGSDMERSFLILMSDPWGGADSPFSQTARSLRFERFNPSTDLSVRSVATPLQRMAPEDLPPSPMGYFPHDIVFLADRGFSLLKEKQLEAVARWVEAGGSVCVCPASAGLKPYHIDFLNKLAGQAAPAFVETGDAASGGPRSRSRGTRSGAEKSETRSSKHETNAQIRSTKKRKLMSKPRLTEAAV